MKDGLNTELILAAGLIICPFGVFEMFEFYLKCLRKGDSATNQIMILCGVFLGGFLFCVWFLHQHYGWFTKRK